MAFVATILRHTNAEIERRREIIVQDRNVQPLEQWEFLRWIGIRLALALERPRGSLQEIVSDQAIPGSIFQPCNYSERFKMSFYRFRQINSVLRFSDNIPPGQNRDPWHEIRSFIDAFNTHMTEAFSPGQFLTVDEIMSAWKGLSSLFDAFGLPHQTKIIRKPEGTGAEMKSVACAESLVILRVDIMEGREQNRLKQWSQQYGEGTAVVLRLCSPWAGSGRIVIADSAFSSVKTLIALFSILGLFFGGMVKTAHTHFPKDYFKQWFDRKNAEHQRDPVNNPRGDWITLQSTFRNTANPEDLREHPIYAVGWADKVLKHIVCNFGTSLRCPSDSRRPRKRVAVDPETGFNETINYEKVIKRPDFIKKFFDGFAAIDINDHYRQGILEMERTWLTPRWWMRIFTTMMGVIFTNCFFAYRLEFYLRRRHGVGEEEAPEFIAFLGKLAYSLILNPFIPGRRDVRRRREEENGIEEHIPGEHRLDYLRNLPEYINLRLGGDPEPTTRRAKRRCKLCKRMASMYCVPCSDTVADKLYVLCGPGSENKCCNEHLTMNNH